MAGLTNEGFVPLTLDEIRTHITTRLEAFSAGFDLSPETLDGQQVEITSFLLSQAYSQLNLLYKSHSPSDGTGAALRNIGLISGVPYGAATRSAAYVQLEGVAGTQVPERSRVSDADGNIFVTQFAATIPSSVQVVALVSGPIATPIGTIVNVEDSITGWTGVSQTQTGTTGDAPQSEVAYRNTRTKTVLRNAVGVADVVKARLEEIGVEQVNVLNNDQLVSNADGTPAQTVHVTIGELTSISDAIIGETILKAVGVGCPTHGATTVTVQDSQGHDHEVKFTRATPVDIFIDLDITFLSDSAGAEEDIKTALVTEINSLPAGEDVIWSRLFSFITPYGKAQINSLKIGKSALALDASNVVLDLTEFAVISEGSINIS